MKKHAAEQHLLPPRGKQILPREPLGIPPVPDRPVAEPELEHRAETFDDDRQPGGVCERAQPGHQPLAELALPLVQPMLGQHAHVVADAYIYTAIIATSAR